MTKTHHTSDKYSENKSESETKNIWMKRQLKNLITDSLFVNNSKRNVIDNNEKPDNLI